MKIMAFVPARGGSKGIPMKNLALLNGKPLIQYTIEAAQKSKFITDIFISSDNDEIINFCNSFDINVPYKRPAELATDTSPSNDAVLHCFKWLEEQNIALPDITVLLQPSSPLRTVEDIDNAIEYFQNSRSESLISVNRMLEHPYVCLKIKKGGWDFLAKPEKVTTNRQEYENDFYRINGAIYIATTDFLLSNRAFTVENETTLYFMDHERGVDIDELIDLQWAEFYLHNQQNRENEAGH